jgi:aminoglycoside 2'-N-acetyltransferase I
VDQQVPDIRLAATADLTASELRRIRDLLEAAFADDGEGFTDDDWAHSLEGIHAVARLKGDIVAHAAVVERELQVDRRPLRTGYVEAVATLRPLQRRGIGAVLMTEVNRHIRSAFELGALSATFPAFYERLDWQLWRGPTYVRIDRGEQRTPDDDGAVMVLRTPATPPIDLTAPISCDWRTGDVW